MRQRLTRNKQADPFTLGRSKENPPAEKYMTGDPSTWAEDADMSHPWEKETREETGHAKENKDMGGDFGKESPKSAAIKSAKELKAKAIKCIRIAEAMFPTASETVWEEQGFALMELSDRAVQATLDIIEKQAELAAAAAPSSEEAKVAAEKVAEDEDDSEEEEMSGEEKKAALLVKRANSLIAEAQFQEALGAADKAESLKKEARSVLATAKKVLAGELPEALKEHMFGDKEEGGEKKEEEKKEAAAAAPAEKKADAAPADMSAGAPVDAAGKPEDAVPADKDMSVTAKATEANRLLEAAKKLMAEVQAAQATVAAPATEKVAEGMDADVSSDKIPEEMKEEEAKEEDEEEECAMEEEEEEAHEADFGMGDMVPPQSDDKGLEGLFMTPEMQDAKEAYEAAFGFKTDDAPMAPPAPAMAGPMAPPAPAPMAPPADAPAAPGLDHLKGASKTASAKKGAKSLKAGLKISSAQSSDDLSNLWDCPPDVSHLFK